MPAQDNENDLSKSSLFSHGSDPSIASVSVKFREEVGGQRALALGDPSYAKIEASFLHPSSYAPPGRE